MKLCENQPTYASYKKPKHQSEYKQKLSEVFWKFAKSKWLMLNDHIAPKSIRIICAYSKISGVFIQKKVVLFTKYKMLKPINV